MAILLNDVGLKQSMLPFSATKHVADLRIGIFTIKEKWEKLTGEKVYLGSENLPDNTKDFIEIPAGYMPCTEDYLQIIEAFKTGVPLSNEFRQLEFPWHLFQNNDWAIRRDFELILNTQRSAEISKSNRITNPRGIFLSEGAVVENCIINEKDGPVFIGKNAVVMDGCIIKGPVAICEGAVVKMGSKIYPGTTIGPYCTAGGEIKNSILSGFSNKAHDGYLGDSVIGEWCNIGAGSNTSNIKNNAGDIIYDLPNLKSPVNVGNKAGLIMGDYSRVAINTSINTGSVIGICCNVTEREFTQKYIPDFSWGNQKYEFVKAIEDIKKWKALKNIELTDNELKTLQSLYYKTFE